MAVMRLGPKPAFINCVLYSCAKALASAPKMSRAGATRVARDALSAMVGSAVVGLDPEPGAAVRERVVAVLRAALVPTHVEPQRFDARMHRAEQTA